jgi:Tat protein secretion system quality control protein TatD with DNase activity
MTNDFEKLEAVTGLTKQHTGLIYSLVGIHPDNVKRTNDKLFQQRAEQLKDAVRCDVLRSAEGPVLIIGLVVVGCSPDHGRTILWT